MGFIQADVCTDAMIVERSKKYETVSTRGFLQANGLLYVCMYVCMYAYINLHCSQKPSSIHVRRSTVCITLISLWNNI